LRAVPSSARAPLAAILRARIAGVHALPMSFTAPSGKQVECALVETRTPEDTALRMAELRRTGTEVAPPLAAQASLREHAHALRAASETPLTLTPLCLLP
jgi:hypothetical protein